MKDKDFDKITLKDLVVASIVKLAEQHKASPCSENRVVAHKLHGALDWIERRDEKREKRKAKKGTK